MCDLGHRSVTLVITSCNRLELLDRTIRSFETYNTYPIDKKIIIEDSGNYETYKFLKDTYGSEFEILFNKSSLGQAASVDKAYKTVKSEYIFHCEDDWEFYRPGFIEDSFLFLDNFPKLKLVLLRSITHDYLVNHTSITFDKDPLITHNIRAYKTKMVERFKESDWVTHSYNPGLIRKSDYHLIGNYSGKTEAEIAMFYKELGFFSVALENDAVLHIGWDDSTHKSAKSNIRIFKKFKHKLFQIFTNPEISS